MRNMTRARVRVQSSPLALSLVVLLACASAKQEADAGTKPDASGTTGSPDSGSGAEPDSGSGAEPVLGCGGLACEACSASNPNVICASGQCASDAECGSIAGSCRQSRGTFTKDYASAGCIGGSCAYFAFSGGCIDFTSCAQCSSDSRERVCGLKPLAADCAQCCSEQFQEFAGPEVPGCICGDGPCAQLCANATICGGEDETPAPCASCMRTALRSGGHCVSDAVFRRDCTGEEDNWDCRGLAQCLATCPGP